MKLIGLGHSELFIEMHNTNDKEIRILSDCWLSNYAFGDFMERKQRLNINMSELTYIHGIYISHAHCDHFDPYTLTEIYKHQKPDILLPETLSYLQDIIKEYLPSAHIVLVPDRETIKWKGLELYGLVYREEFMTNENDVMTLAIANNSELLYMEIDSAPPDSKDFWDELYQLCTKKKYKTICYLGTRNELEGMFKSLDAKSPQERLQKIEDYKERRMEEIHWTYAKHDEDPELPDPMQLAGFVKVLNGQGIVTPEDLGKEYDEILLPVTIADIAEWEQEIVNDYDRNFPVDYLDCGRVLVLENGNISQEKSPSYLDKVSSRDFTFNPKSVVVRHTIDKPLSTHIPDENQLKSQMLRELNNRFLPYQIASIDNTLRELVLRSPNKKYVIEVRFGNAKNYYTHYFSYSFKSMKFVSSKEESHVNEIYWANDIHDLFEGRQEMFSTFLHHLHKGKPLHFWSCMNMPFVASDLVQKKFRLHFERAKNGETADSFAKEYFKNFLTKS